MNIIVYFLFVIDENTGKNFNEENKCNEPNQ